MKGSFLTLGFWLTVLVPFLFGREFENGDIIFQRSQTFQCDAIEAATKSPYTHVGIIFIEKGKPIVYEAVGPVRRTPLRTWIKRGKGKRYVVKRLRDRSKVNFEEVKAEAAKMLGRNYDWLFDWSDKRIYCSELVWKVYKRSSNIRIGELKELRDFDLTSPLVQGVIKQRYGDKPPMEMKVISPGDMFTSKLLFTVEEKWD